MEDDDEPHTGKAASRLQLWMEIKRLLVQSLIWEFQFGAFELEYWDRAVHPSQWLISLK